MSLEIEPETTAAAAAAAESQSSNHPLTISTTTSNDEQQLLPSIADDGSDNLLLPPPVTTATTTTPPTTTEKKKPTWRSHETEEDDTVIIIEEEVPTNIKPPPSRPVKKPWISSKNNRNSSNKQQLDPTNMNDNGKKTINNDANNNHHSSSDGGNGDQNKNDSYNTAADSRRNNQQHQQQKLGSKPKLTNMSLLSSAVAHATLERCLLGVNGGETTTTTTEKNNDTTNNIDSSSSSSSKSNNNPPGQQPTIIDYSKQCKPGHVIDILELRRLSSRGVPDEPPTTEQATRSRAASAPAAATTGRAFMEGISEESSSKASIGPLDILMNDNNHNNNNNKNSGNNSGNNINPHRSYRPLVWRVLLGYLPPQTSSWNDVLQRDRELYNLFVKEMFSSICPAPHDVYDEVELKKQEVYRSDAKKKKEKEEEGEKTFVIDDDDDDADAPGTPTESTTKEAAAAAAATTTPLTPGLLSARMQQEWVRGLEMGGQGSIFDKSPGGVSSQGVNDTARISPMCAMNTPRTRIRKEAFKSKGGGNVVMEEEEAAGTESGSTSDHLANMESLLLPNEDEEEDDDDDGDNEDKGDGEIEGGGQLDTLDSLHTIEVEDKEIGEKNDKNNENADAKEEEKECLEKTQSESESPDSEITRSISITNTGSEGLDCEGVELCRTSSNEDDDDDDGTAPIPPMTGMDSNTDEEENILLLDEIRKDVIRTHPDLRFFLEPNEDLGQKRYAALERILFVWAKLNKGVRYVQGMNEIVGTLYFVLAHDSNEDWANEAEADTYFLFNSLMVEMRDVFVPDLDEADTGIHGRISNMITLLSLHDPEVRCHLDSVGIDPSFYSVRWLTTLLSREFLLPDTIRLWDSMFASTHKDNFLRYVSVTMVMVIRDQLLSGDFSACLRLLQAYPPTNLDRLLESSRALWIYESQITLACHKGGISLGHALRSIAPPPAIVMAYGLPGGVAPPIREQVRQAGERGLRVARGAANGASYTVASAGRSFFGNAMSYLRSGNGEGKTNKEVRRSKSTM